MWPCARPSSSCKDDTIQMIMQVWRVQFWRWGVHLHSCRQQSGSAQAPVTRHCSRRGMVRTRQMRVLLGCSYEHANVHVLFQTQPAPLQCIPCVRSHTTTKTHHRHGHCSPYSCPLLLHPCMCPRDLPPSPTQSNALNSHACGGESPSSKFQPQQLDPRVEPTHPPNHPCACMHVCTQAAGRHALGSGGCRREAAAQWQTHRGERGAAGPDEWWDRGWGWRVLEPVLCMAV